MMDDRLFQIPDPLPWGAVLIGPPGWPDPASADGKQCRVFADPRAALDWLKDQRTAEGLGAESRIVVIHQDAFAGQAGIERLEIWLGRLSGLRAPYLPVLLHGNLPAAHLVRFFRAGLFDALGAPLERPAWVNMLIRAERRLALRQQSALILEATGRSQDLLRQLRRELGEEADLTAGDLLRAQETLETANRQLTDAVAELSLLYRFGRQLSTARNWDQVLRQILETLGNFVGAGGAALVLRTAAGGVFWPRQTWQWDESGWDRILVNLTDQMEASVAESILAPGVFQLDGYPGDAGAGTGSGRGRRIIALPLEHQELRLGFLLLLFPDPAAKDSAARRYLPFLQAVQVVLSEEVAGAQMLDRIRDIGAFNARILATVSSSIWVLDDEGRTVFCNRAGRALLTGQPPGAQESTDFLFQIGRGRLAETDGTGGGLSELILDARLHLGEAAGLLLPFLRRSPGGAFRGEGTIASDSGEVVPVLVQTSLMEGKARERPLLVVVAEDLRETRQLELERLRSEQLEGLVEMSATLAHEIRNPLMGLSAQAELLAGQLQERDPKTRYLEVITREVDRIDQTITRLLTFVKPYAPALAEDSLWDLACDALELVRDRAGRKGLALAFAAEAGGTSPVEEADWSLVMDAGQVKQVLLNLLINAVDAAPPQGRVGLTLQQTPQLELPARSRGARRRAAGVVIRVSDDGPGVAAADLARIFRPFFTTKSSGTGLGLSICQKIVSAHGGEIVVGRERDQTVFQVRLPRRPEGAASSTQREEA